MTEEHVEVMNPQLPISEHNMLALSHPRAIYDAQGVERCRACAKATYDYLNKERRDMEVKLVALTGEQANLESFINILELQLSRPPERKVDLPVEVQYMRERMCQVLLKQLNLVKELQQLYTKGMLEVTANACMMSGGLWQYGDDVNRHNVIKKMLCQ